MVKVLHYIPGFRKGGIESLVLDIFENIGTDIKFDILVEHGMADITAEDRSRIEKLGGEIIEINPFTPHSLLRHIKDIYQLISKNEYQIIHSHSLGKRCIVLLIARLMKVPKRILHGHTNRFETNIFINKLGTWISIYSANKYIACSEKVAETMFGRIKDKVKIIYNGIDLKKFSQKKSKSVHDTIEFIHVGRYTFAKNHEFLVKILKELRKKQFNIFLTLVGDGPEENRIRNLVKENSLENYVRFLPSTSDIPTQLEKADYAIFPSIYEGFGIAVLEFQAMNLPCFVSQNVPKEVDLGLCEFISLDKSEEEWSDYIIKYIQDDKGIREVKLDKIDIKNITKQVKEFYLEKG